MKRHLETLLGGVILIAFMALTGVTAAKVLMLAAEVTRGLGERRIEVQAPCVATSVHEAVRSDWALYACVRLTVQVVPGKQGFDNPEQWFVTLKDASGSADAFWPAPLGDLGNQRWITAEGVVVDGGIVILRWSPATTPDQPAPPATATPAPPRPGGQRG